MTHEMIATPGPVTEMIGRLGAGDKSALPDLLPHLYDDLRSLARKQLRNERAGHTLSTTDLVNEAYLKLIEQRQLNVEGRPQFFAIAATTMRRILVDYARARKRIKRGNGVVPIPLDEAEEFLSEAEADEVLEFDSALDRLALIKPIAVDVVQCRFYSGLTLAETAEALGVSTRTVQRTWIMARAWLRKEVG